jgi:lariat debranching enzyme
MPDKYKKLGDFAHYYSGQLMAPYLTIFVGGNHEASNYLRELHYGGWACPNIYFLGAANVMRIGPVRISGMSGIWKGYDYRKPHSERLPFNDDDLSSIYHVREIDIRKLLQVRTQVDVGLSHDWIRGIEYYGDTDRLFRKKSFLRQDSEEGKLGNQAALQVVERLRPAYWFSAHLHVNFAAVMPHDGVTLKKTGSSPGEPAEWAVVSVGGPATSESAVAAAPTQSSASIALDGDMGTKVSPNATDTKASLIVNSQAIGDKAAHLEGWNGFQTTARKAEANEMSSFRKEFQEAGPQTVKAPETTWKRVTYPDGNRRVHPAVCIDHSTPSKKVKVENAEEINLDLSDEDCNTVMPPCTLDSSQDAKVRNEEEIELDSSDESMASSPQKTPHDVQMFDSVDVQIEPICMPALTEDDSGNAQVQNDEEINLESGDESMTSPPRKLPVSVNKAETDSVKPVSASALTDGAYDSRIASEVDETLRNSLPASLSRPVAPPPQKSRMSHPPAIENKVTRFLALDKPNNRDAYIQLVEIHPVSNQESVSCERPYRLQYDKEWLAITRVFRDDIRIGEPNIPVPPDFGEEEYLCRIMEEEQWVEENIVQKGLMNVPTNFHRSAPKYDPSIPIASSLDQPREYGNLQTAEFTELLQIRNPFEISEEEAIARNAAGPRPSNHRSFGGHRGPGRGRGGRGGRGGGRGGRGGRGRGGGYY